MDHLLAGFLGANGANGADGMPSVHAESMRHLLQDSEEEDEADDEEVAPGKHTCPATKLCQVKQQIV